MTAPCRVMVIDDDADIRESLADALAEAGHDVLCAGDGAHGLRVLAGGVPLPGLILLDLMMPVMDGLDFRAAQLADPRLRDIPVVLLSADAAVRERAAELKVSGFYRKPIGLQSLYELVARYGEPGEPS